MSDIGLPLSWPLSWQPVCAAKVRPELSNSWGCKEHLSVQKGQRWANRCLRQPGQASSQAISVHSKPPHCRAVLELVFLRTMATALAR
jgi:hypothetical protein